MLSGKEALGVAVMVGEAVGFRTEAAVTDEPQPDRSRKARVMRRFTSPVTRRRLFWLRGVEDLNVWRQDSGDVSRHAGHLPKGGAGWGWSTLWSTRCSSRKEA